jgi:hypothetical protein
MTRNTDLAKLNKNKNKNYSVQYPATAEEGKESELQDTSNMHNV